MVDFLKKNQGVVLFVIAAVVFAAVIFQGTGSGEAPDKQADGEGGERTRPAAAVVLETLDIGNYTILKLAMGLEEHIWVASPPLEARLGDLVVVENAQLMEDFYSSTLDRTFDEIYFVDAAAVVDQDRNVLRRSLPPGGTALTPEDGSPTGGPNAVDVPQVDPPAGGISIAKLNQDYADLTGVSVAIRGTIVKALPGILGTNWYHLQDGSAAGPAGDVIFTSDEMLERGAMVTVSGKVELNQEKGEFMMFDFLIRADSVSIEDHAPDSAANKELP